MFRDLTRFAVAAASVLGAVVARAENMAPACPSPLANVEWPNNLGTPASAASGGSLCLQGDPAAVQLEVHRTTVAAVLAALSTAYRISYQSATALDQARDGTYSGPLGQVIARMLAGYNYVIKNDGEALTVIIIGRTGDQPAAGAIATQADEKPVRAAARVSRNR